MAITILKICDVLIDCDYLQISDDSVTPNRNFTSYDSKLKNT